MPAEAMLRARIAALCRADETGLALHLADEAALPPHALARAQAQARRLAEHVRKARSRAGGVDSLMHEFSLSTAEGIALMCLAEALLRIPDPATRDRLITDKLAQGDWSAHLGLRQSLFVNATAWGLLVTGRLVPTHSETTLGAALAMLLRRGGMPLIRRAIDLSVRLLGRQFVTGETIAEALEHSAGPERRGYRFSYDMLGEAAVTAEDAERYFRAYAGAISAIGAASAGRGLVAGPGISVKLSALHPRYTALQRTRVLAELLPKLRALLLLARSCDIGFNIDAEEADRLDLSLDILVALAEDPSFRGWDGLGFVVQAYGRRARAVIDFLAALGRRTGHRFMLRLVKGAYWDTEIKAAQVAGMDDYPVFTRKVHTDVSYLACARAMLAAPDAIYPQFATHNAMTIAAVQAMAGDAAFEFQCLHGMGETIYDPIVAEGVPCRIYAPVGPHETLLAYLVRRLLENGANSSFVNQIVDPRIALDSLVADPVALLRTTGGRPHPAIPAPTATVPGRRSGRGMDLADADTREAAAALLAISPLPERAGPLLAEDRQARGRPAPEVRNPADRRQLLGHVAEADAADIAAAIAYAEAAAEAWAATPPARRAGLLERWAGLLEQERDALISLAVREAGKTVANAVGEVREAVDFCRYYAAEIRAWPVPRAARGPMVCISPWNFPLAIFTGQIAACLAAGNPVLAKPAEQTPLIAARAVQLAWQAGVPRGALQLLPGPGETVGARLVASPAIQGVLFTGSSEVARLINQALAARTDDPVLIAETGGMNAMIVDSSALAEQVVGDVLASAFDSAGQRCSALRILCLQEEIATPVLAMLRGALAELRVGDPSDLATDIGPLIDEPARASIVRHLDFLAGHGVEIATPALGAECAHGSFVAPVIAELPSLDLLSTEIFGPVLHVVRWRAGELEALVARINALGYGLTHGVHTRIDETVDCIRARVRAGNLYVNRNIIGAVVGVQPFGGEGLSGTGPKAGGPLYLERLVRDPAPVAVRADIPLPGPTGEQNTLSLLPRGLVACLAGSAEALRAQAEAALGTGNFPVLPPGDASARIVASLGPDSCRIATDDPTEMAELVLTDAQGPALSALRTRLAARPGAIVPVVVPDAAGSYPAIRLLRERVVSINTAAAGGNAALLAMGP
jgi:RHH-type transcriptional regulator, proline utilization regulon repressor / proline dehydrogenase / delta 1-pyrroline-5-carboxylate dehydrogenase